MTDQIDEQTDARPEPATDAARQQAAAAYAHTGADPAQPVVDTTDTEDLTVPIDLTDQPPVSDEEAGAVTDAGTDAPDEVEPVAAGGPPAEVDHEARAAEDPRTPGQLLAELELVTAERDDYLESLQRLQAEFDNFRRRTTREAAVARAAGVGDLAGRLLDVLDDLDRTVEAASASADAGLADGVGAIRRKLLDELTAAGIERVEAADVPFDATRHEAVQQVPAETPVEVPEVAQVLRPGYLQGERVLRAAMVTVRQ